MMNQMFYLPQQRNLTHRVSDYVSCCDRMCVTVKGKVRIHELVFYIKTMICDGYELRCKAMKYSGHTGRITQLKFSAEY